MRRARQEIEARTWDVFPNKETQRCFQSKTVLWKPITTNSPYGGARIVPLSPAGRVSEMLSPKLCHATTASPNGPIEPKPPKGSTDASQSKAVPKFIVIPMKVQNPRFQATESGIFYVRHEIGNKRLKRKSHRWGLVLSFVALYLPLCNTFIHIWQGI